MAGSKRRRRRTRRTRRNPAPAAFRRRRRRRTRRNPSVNVMGMVRGVVPFTIKAGVRALEATGGKIVVRAVRRMAKQSPGSILGSVIEGGTAVVGGVLLSRFVNPQLGEMFAVGGLQAPLETTIQRLAVQYEIPVLKDSLGDDGFYLSDSLGLISDDMGGVDGYVPGESGALGEYVPLVA